MISIKDSVIIFVLASTGVGLGIVPLVSYVFVFMNSC